MILSRDSICLKFWNAQKSKNFLFDSENGKNGAFRNFSTWSIFKLERNWKWNSSIFGHFKILSKCYHMTKSSFTCFLGHFILPPVIYTIYIICIYYIFILIYYMYILYFYPYSWSSIWSLNWTSTTWITYEPERPGTREDSFKFKGDRERVHRWSIVWTQRPPNWYQNHS